MTGGMKTLALRLVLIGAFAIPFAADARAQWGWTTPAAPAAPAPAQPGSTPPPAGVSRGENFSNKPAAQLFASDCTGAGCHKGPQGLAKDRGAGSLASFLREHYTNSRESATALAAYLVGVPGAARPDPKQQPPRAAARTDEKPAERKPPGVTPPAAVPTAATPSGETSDAKPAAKPAPRPPRQAVAPPQTPPAAAPAPAPAPTPEPPPAAAPVPAAPAAPPEPAKPQWDIFD